MHELASPSRSTCCLQAALQQHGDVVQLHTCLGVFRAPASHTSLIRVVLTDVGLTALAHLASEQALDRCLAADRPLHALAALWQPDKVLLPHGLAHVAHTEPH